MAWVATAIGGSAALGVGSSIFGGIMGNSSGKKQAEAMRYAADKASQTALEMNNRARADLSPFRDMGMRAGNTLSHLLMGGGNMKNQLQGSDLFNWQSEMGTRNMNRELAARGRYDSGAGLEALSMFNNQLVADEGQRMFDRLFGLTGMGANAAAGMASGTNATGATMANATLQGYTGAANAAAGGRQQMIQGVQGAMGAVAQGMGDYGQYQMMQPMLQRFSSGNNSYGSSPPTQARSEAMFDFSNFSSKG
jgi:hypothetical protein